MLFAPLAQVKSVPIIGPISGIPPESQTTAFWEMLTCSLLAVWQGSDLLTLSPFSEL